MSEKQTQHEAFDAFRIACKQLDPLAQGVWNDFRMSESLINELAPSLPLVDVSLWNSLPAERLTLESASNRPPDQGGAEWRAQLDRAAQDARSTMGCSPQTEPNPTDPTGVPMRTSTNEPATTKGQFRSNPTMNAADMLAATPLNQLANELFNSAAVDQPAASTTNVKKMRNREGFRPSQVEGSDGRSVAVARPSVDLKTNENRSDKGPVFPIAPHKISKTAFSTESDRRSHQRKQAFPQRSKSSNNKASSNVTVENDKVFSKGNASSNFAVNKYDTPSQENDILAFSTKNADTSVIQLIGTISERIMTSDRPQDEKAIRSADQSLGARRLSNHGADDGSLEANTTHSPPAFEVPHLFRDPIGDRSLIHSPPNSQWTPVLDLRDTPVASDDAWQAKRIVELINDELVRQARRQGVDFS